jgi:hypothetical protein
MKLVINDINCADSDTLGNLLAQWMVRGWKRQGKRHWEFLSQCARE